MIDKIFPRILNSSKDNRIRSKTEMNDALNIVATEDFDALDGANEGGNAGVIKPQKGNEARPIKTFDLDAVFPPTPEVNRRVLGRVVDSRAGVVYMFIYSETPSEMGVYAYDAYGFFPGGDQAWRPIYTTSEFQFSSTGRVVGDVVHITGPNDTFRPILYFTDNENEPRRIDVLRCVENASIPNGFEYTENSVDDVDVITACTKAPIHPIQFEFLPDPDRAQSNFRRIPGMQFAFQCIYFTGEESALSTYSDIAVPEEYLRQGFTSTQLELPKFLQLVVPSLVDGMPNFSEEVQRIRLLVRQGNIGAWYEIDEVDWTGVGGNPVVYNFYNDEVLTGLTNEEQNRDFDAHPQVAEALAVVENRLFYGNYVEGFDEVPLEANVNVLYQDRPNEFININIPVSPVIVPMDSLEPTLAGDPTAFREKSTGFVMDLSQLPDTLPGGAVLTCQIRVAFGGAVEAYQGAKNFHANQLLGDGLNATIAQTLDLTQNNALQNGQLAGENYASQNTQGLFSLNGTLPVGFIGEGVGRNTLRWQTIAQAQSVFGTQNELGARVGGHGLSPLRFRGPQGASEQLVFTFTATSQGAITNPETSVRDVLRHGLQGSDFLISGWDVTNSQINPSYGFDLGLKDPTESPEYQAYLNDPATAPEGIEGVGQMFLGTGPEAPGSGQEATYSVINTDTPEYAILPTKNSAHRDVAKLIFPVGTATANTTYGTAASTWNSFAAQGFCIVNSATLSFRLRAMPDMNNDPLGSLVFYLELDQVGDCDVRTCLPILNPGGLLDGGVGPFDQPLRFEGWRVFSASYLNQYNVLDMPSADPRDMSAFLGNIAQGSDNDLLPLDRRARYLGFLYSQTTGVGNPIPGGDLFVNNRERREQLLITLGLEVNETNLFGIGIEALGTSLQDGESHPAVYRGEYLDTENLDSGFNGLDHVFTPSDPDIGCYGTMAVMYGCAAWATNFPQNLQGESTGDLLSTPLSFQSAFERIGGSLINSGGVGATDDGAGGGAQFYQFETSVPEGTAGPRAEIQTDIFIGESDLSGAFRSFKTNATHALGIIHYDQRGRPGNVQPIDPVFVPGYSPAERNGLGFQGRVALQVELLSDPPDWAFYYQLVYAGNSTVQNFIQYSVGGAYHAIDGAEEQLNNLYVSLNHLQFHPTVSYANAFGAVHPDGTSDLYVYSPGDYLRVISYYTDATNQVYPTNLIFEIAGQVTLTADADTNPLMEADNVQATHLTGQFLVIKDNQNAEGFRFSDVIVGNNEANTTSTNYWRGRCIVEIITPRRIAEGEELLYRETSQVYNIGRGNGGVYYQTPTLLFDNGDVWWRAVPVNVQDYQNGQFLNLIQPEVDDLGNESTFPTQARFRSVYLESTTFNDTFPGCDVNGLGKVKRYRPNATQVRRFSSVIYSDENNYSVRRLRYTVFNPYLAPFKDLPNEFGNINALLNYNDSLFVVQEDKASMLPINRQIISDVLGAESLIATSKVVGNQQLISGHAGADNNRESVIKVDDSVYFAHKTNKQVYRFTPKGGLQVISDAGMNAFFVDVFEDYGYGDLVRVVSGYDPLNDEYIITVLTTEALAEPGINEYTQPNLGLLADVGLGDGGSGLGEEGEGVIDWDTSYGGPATDYTDEIISTGGTAPDGVSPTVDDGWPAPNGDGIGNSGKGQIDVVVFNQGIIDDTSNGGTAGFADPLESTSYTTRVQLGGGFNPYTVDVREIWPVALRETLGPWTWNGPGDSQISFDGDTTITGIPQNINGNPNINNPIASWCTIDVLNINASNYRDRLGEGEVLFGNLSLRAALEVRKHYLVQKKNELIASIKNGPETEILQLIDKLPDDLDNVIAQLTTLGINNDPNIAALLNQTQVAITDLQQFALTVLGSTSTQILSDPDGQTTVVGGFGSFTETSYPLGPIEYNVLTQFNSLLATVGDTFIPLLGLEGVNLSSILTDLASANATLRNQVDVLTDQVQALSDATLNFDGGEPLISGVTSTQLESSSINTIAQDGLLTYSDVTRDFDPLIQFIISNNATTADALTPDLGAQFVVQFLADVGETLLSQIPNVGVDPTTIAGSEFSASQKLAQQLASLRNDPDSIRSLSNLDGFTNPLNIVGESLLTTQDLTTALVSVGATDASGAFLNPFAPYQPLVKVAGLREIQIDTMMTEPDALQVYINMAEAANLDIVAIDSNPSAGDHLERYPWVRANLKNLEAGRYDVNLATGSYTYIDTSLPPVELPWESASYQAGYWGPPGVNDAGSVMKTKLDFGEKYWNLLSPFYPATPGFVWTVVGDSNAAMQEIMILMEPYADMQEGTSWSPELTQKFIEVYTTQDIPDSTLIANPAVSLNPFLRFGNPADNIQLTEDQVNTAIVNAINYTSS